MFTARNGYPETRFNARNTDTRLLSGPPNPNKDCVTLHCVLISTL